ncbi:MAG: DNA-binding protein [Clostridiales bacterium]|nr:DNA-binding protein [Clostridiales bacterium]
MRACLAFDSSNYTTSMALFDGISCRMAGKLLEVPTGGLGLRQSEAHFAHTKNLPALAAQLFESCPDSEIACVAASTRPLERDGSYMPCFLAGESQARVIASVLKVPFYAFSHQQGHLAAAAWSCGNYGILKTPFLAWHLSGGTTELLLVKPCGNTFTAERIGGSEDLAAGQLIDRTGKLLGTGFPAGAQVDTLSQKADKDIYFTARLRGLEFSLSGLENKIKDLCSANEKPENIAYFAVKSITDTILSVTKKALESYGQMTVLCSGGVARSSIMREAFSRQNGVLFAKAEYSSDNAAGIAILGWEMNNERNHSNTAQ